MTMVITGLGTVSPAGTGTDAYWAALVLSRGVGGGNSALVLQHPDHV
ncbi:hypothetical protein Q7689_04850 [Nocardiopsis tropica]|nr:hypothetical protein [Nocardiopsis tropica]